MGRSKRIADMLLDVWPLYKLGMRMGRLPVLGTLLQPAFSPRLHQVTMLPVNEPVDRGRQAVLPYTLLHDLLQRASARFIMNECVCRSREGCHDFPIDLGCLFLGDGAARIHPSLGRLCDVDEAARHVQRGLQAGLYPLVAHTVVDALTFGIPYRRMLTVCFCCECCCLVQRGLRTGPASLLKVVQPLPGVKVMVGQDCAACGECVPACPVRAISMNHNGAEISPACKGCGICLNACPNGTIHVEMDGKVDLMSVFEKQMNGYADITSSGSR
jgi:ferredoxin